MGQGETDDAFQGFQKVRMHTGLPLQSLPTGLAQPSNIIPFQHALLSGSPYFHLVPFEP